MKYCVAQCLKFVASIKPCFALIMTGLGSSVLEDKIAKIKEPIKYFMETESEIIRNLLI
jgi:hypothetical protein